MSSSSDRLFSAEGRIRDLQTSNRELKDRVNEIEKALHQLLESADPRHISEELGREAEERMLARGVPS